MKQREAIQAYNAIQAICEREKNRNNASLRFNYALFKIKKMIEPQYEFQVERQKLILDDMKPEMLKDGSLDFGSRERKEEFQRRLEELGDLGIALPEFKKQKISFSEDVEIEVDEIAALEPFVEFTE